MRHLVKGRKLNRTASHRKALLSNLSCSLIKHKRIITTEPKAKELSPFGITVNAIGPTPVETDLIKNVPKDKIDKLIDSQTVKRFGNINDIINVVSFFISPTSDFITGQTLYLGGIN